jgi:hypothetical protein
MPERLFHFFGIASEIFAAWEAVESLVVKIYDADLVVGFGRSHQSERSGHHSGSLVAHAATIVDEDAHRYGTGPAFGLT